MHAFLRDLTPRHGAERELRRLAGIVAATGDAILSQVARRHDHDLEPGRRAAVRLAGRGGARPQRRADRARGRACRSCRPLMRSVEAGIAVPAVRDRPAAQGRLARGGLADRVAAARARRHGDGACASARDITETHRQAAELREAEERFRLAFDAVPVGMVLTSLAEADRGRILRVNDGFTWMLGYTEEELLQRTFADITHPDDLAAESELLAPFMAGKQRTIRFEKRYVRGDGLDGLGDGEQRRRRGSGRAAAVRRHQVEDITARRAEQERLQALALADPLTGLANRLLFEDRLAQAVHRAGRHDRTIAVIYCDLDRFKPVNDQFGHARRRRAAQAGRPPLMVAMRPSDTVARLGGDEFAVVCEDLPTADAATGDRRPRPVDGRGHLPRLGRRGAHRLQRRRRDGVRTAHRVAGAGRPRRPEHVQRQARPAEPGRDRRARVATAREAPTPEPT
jgi:PAS domain S-box-containing protein